VVRASERLDIIEVENKSINDFVTEVDRSSEQEILKQLRKAYPDHGFLCEESGIIEGTGPGADYQWIIDPLDGTTNYINGIPHYAISIACLFKGKIEHAVILDPVRQEEFTATRGRGAQLNGRRIRVTQRRGLEGALLATGIPFQARQQEHIDSYLATLKVFSENTAGIRRAGAASLDLAYLAAGRFDGFWEIGLSKWDIAAGILLITEAGGLVSDFNGQFEHMKSGNLVAASPKVFKAMIQAIKPSLGHI
jgi:myo-inositol-1(or 4)-monophosphatase